MQKPLSPEQKAKIAIQGDLFGVNLSVSEKETMLDAFDSAKGDMNKALASVDSVLAGKVRNLLDMGIRFSIELEKLEQRGVVVLFLDGSEAAKVSALFEYRPRLLFCVGHARLIVEQSAKLFYSSKDYKSGQCNGILVADKAIDVLLRDSQIVASVRESRGLIVSDSAKNKASIDKSRVAAKASNGRSGKAVFISGSRTQSVIAKGPQESLEAIISQGITVLLGDSSKGVDKEVADFLRAPLYENVKLYTVEQGEPRIASEPAWGVVNVPADQSLSGQQRQMVKDRAMADAADFGMAIFRPIEKNRYGALQVSSGTMRNIIQMLLCGKPVKLFYSYEGEMRAENIKSLEALEAILLSYGRERLLPSEQAAILSSKGVSPDDDPASVKCKKIMAKYRSLLKDERDLLESKKGSGDGESAVQVKLPGFE